MDNNNNGKGIFYGVIGVATLIVAIIGATFAYFTATNTNSGIGGTAATAGLDLSVTLKSTEAKGNMIPQKPTTIDAATGNKTSCVDANGNTVCKVYEVTIKNAGTSAVKITGNISFGDNKLKNLNWAIKANGSKAPDFVTDASGGTFAQGVFTKATTDLISPQDDEVGTITLAGAASKKFEIVVFIAETGSAQNTEDTGAFTGTITFNSAGGSGVTSTFQ